MIKLRRITLAACLYALADSGIAQVPVASPKAASGPVTEAVDVRGAVQIPMHLSLQDLRAFPADQIGEVIQPPKAPSTGPGSRLRGVRLSAVLDRAKLAGAGHNDWKRAVVLATASDGYRVVFSWSELFNTRSAAARWWSSSATASLWTTAKAASR